MIIAICAQSSGNLQAPWTEVEQGYALLFCFSSHTTSKCSFNSVHNTNLFAFFVLFIGDFTV